MSNEGTPADDADVIVVGAGPSGATTAYYLAQAGVNVLLLEKARFPREKVCGDGLTPRAVKSLISMGVDTSPEAGWLRNKGLRVIGAGMRLELDWPDLDAFPGYGLVRPRADFDEVLARRAQAAGAKLLEEVTVTGPVCDDRTGQIVGVTARQEGTAKDYRARAIVAADGNSSRLAWRSACTSATTARSGWPSARTTRSPRHEDDYLESWLDLWDGDKLLPGYGWIFGMGDGTSNVGLGLLNTSNAFGNTDYRELLKRWLRGMPAEWGFVEENRTEPVRGAALPMGFNRTPAYYKGLLLAGDAAGMVNPFNGEGIAYAMESGEILARVISQALARPTRAETGRVLASYPDALRDAYGGYYALGRLFVQLIGKPQLMRYATRKGMNRPALMRFALKLLANLSEPRGGDASDRVISAMTRLAPNPR